MCARERARPGGHVGPRGAHIFACIGRHSREPALIIDTGFILIAALFLSDAGGGGVVRSVDARVFVVFYGEGCTLSVLRLRKGCAYKDCDYVDPEGHAIDRERVC